MDDPAVVWHVLLTEALATMRINVYGEEDKRAAITARYERQMRRFRGRR